MPKANCCGNCARRSECEIKPRSKYYCALRFGDPGCAAFRCRPLRCFRDGISDIPGQGKLFGGEERKSG